MVVFSVLMFGETVSGVSAPWNANPEYSQVAKAPRTAAAVM